MKHIVLTGSAGFVGSHLTERFLASGYRVTGIDNYISGQRCNTALFTQHPSFRFCYADVSAGLPTIPENVDWVLHFASPASPPHYQAHPIETLMVGAQGTQHCLEFALRKNAKFMLASTSEVYGDPQVHPQPETYWGHVNPTGIRSCYDEAKRYAEALTMAFQRQHDLDIRIIRIFNTYGPRMRSNDGRVVTNFITQALAGLPLTIYGDGLQTRSFQYIDDLIEGICRLMNVTNPGPINLGNPDEYTVLEFAQYIRDLVNPKLPICHKAAVLDDPQQRRPDIELAHTVLGWNPQVPLKDGLIATIDAFTAERPIEISRPLCVSI